MLSIYNIYENLILESIGQPEIIDAINDNYRIRIMYQGENEKVPRERLIDVYVLGTSIANNKIIRAYQPNGFTTTENAKWKTFRVDRITRWEKTKLHIGKRPISDYDSTIPKYKEDGTDKKMVHVDKFRKFQRDVTPQKPTPAKQIGKPIQKPVGDEEKDEENDNILKSIDTFRKTGDEEKDMELQKRVDDLNSSSEIPEEPEKDITGNDDVENIENELDNKK